MSTFKRLITVGVTSSPFFKVRNLIRDSLQSIATAEMSYNPMSNIKPKASNSPTATARSTCLLWLVVA
jgi:hypothetical protein